VFYRTANIYSIRSTKWISTVPISWRRKAPRCADPADYRAGVPAWWKTLT